jgi:phytoene dehydrogenase-like protein
MPTRVGLSYKQHSPIGQFDAIVIGSGMGGLAAAALLGKHGGKRVLVLERHYTVGGYTHVFRRRDYEWDVGLHYIGQVHDPLSEARRLFDDITNKKLAWAPMPEVYDRIIIADRAYDLVAGADRFRESLQRYFPQEPRAIAEYLGIVRACTRRSTLYFMDKVIPAPLARIIGPLMRAPFLRYARQTTLDVLQGLTHDRELIAVLTGQYGDYGLPPAQSSFAMHAAVVAHYLQGAAYPVGGAAQIAATVAPVIEAAGGIVLINAEVQEILVERNRAVGVRMVDGRELRAPIVMSDAGVANTFGRLLPKEMAESLGLGEVSESVRPSVAHLCLYVGLKHTAEELGLTGTNLWIYPDAHHDSNFARFLHDPESPFPSVYISFPSAKDPSFQNRFPGRATIEVIIPAPYEWFEPLAATRWKHRGHEYEDFKARFAERLLQQLYTHVPSVRGKVDYSELSTPLSTRHFSGHPRGEMYGLGHMPERFGMRLRSQTPVRGLYLTGQDLVMAGVVGALYGGVMAASAVLQRNVLREILK